MNGTKAITDKYFLGNYYSIKIIGWYNCRSQLSKNSSAVLLVGTIGNYLIFFQHYFYKTIFFLEFLLWAFLGIDTWLMVVTKNNNNSVLYKAKIQIPVQLYM